MLLAQHNHSLPLTMVVVHVDQSAHQQLCNKFKPHGSELTCATALEVLPICCIHCSSSSLLFASSLPSLEDAVGMRFIGPGFSAALTASSQGVQRLFNVCSAACTASSSASFSGGDLLAKKQVVQLAL